MKIVELESSLHIELSAPPLRDVLIGCLTLLALFAAMHWLGGASTSEDPLGVSLTALSLVAGILLADGHRGAIALCRDEGSCRLRTAGASPYASRRHRVPLAEVRGARLERGRFADTDGERFRLVVETVSEDFPLSAVSITGEPELERACERINAFVRGERRVLLV